MKYDVAIIGAGPAGLSAGIFTGRAGLKTVCFERLAVGGISTLAVSVENYPGFLDISGFELAENMKRQVQSCGVEIVTKNILKLSKTKSGFKLTTDSEVFEAKKVVIACGAKTRRLALDKEKEFIGKGISYCASCDGNFFKNKNVAVVGGGNTAVADCVYLSRLAKSVVMLNRSERFRANQNELDKIKEIKNVKILTNAVVKKLLGSDVLTGLEIEVNGKLKKIKVDGLFVAIGYQPNLDFLNIDVNVDKFGYIIVDENQQTSIKNLYACGDIVSKNFKQIITACADGARAGNSCIGG